MKKHLLNFKERYDVLQDIINFLLENEFSFTIESNNYIDENYFNFRNSIRIYEFGDIYIEINENDIELYIYDGDYSKKTGRPNKVIKGINKIYKHLKEIKNN